MSDEPQKPDDQTPPSEEELQRRARDVWKIVRFVLSGTVLLGLLVVVFVGYWLFHFFGMTGLVVGLILLGVGLYFLNDYLMSF
jgi:F0F1-type ATP synthase assembly protein I